MTQNNVTVIIAAYNASRTIRRAIRSALEQPEVTEIMVVDDASSDNTIECAQAADDGSGRMKILKQGKNSGPSAARNRAIHESNAPWIAILDSDDFFLPGRIAGLLQYAENADLVADDMFQVHEDAVDGARRALLGKEFTLPCIVTFRQFVLSNVSKRGRSRAELGFIKPIIRRSFLQTNSIHYRENMSLGEDYELYSRSLALGGRLMLVPAQGYISVVRSNSLSGSHSEHDLLQLRDCDLDMMTINRLSEDDRKALKAHYSSIDCRLQWRNLILAVKNKNIRAAYECFQRPWPVSCYLLARLIEQAYQRSIGRLFNA